MRLHVCLFVLIIVTQCHCEPDWFPNILDRFADKTEQFRTYVKEKGRDFNNLYVKSVKNKIKSYFGVKGDDGKTEVYKKKKCTVPTSELDTTETNYNLLTTVLDSEASTGKTEPSPNGFMTKLKKSFRKYLSKPYGNNDDFKEREEVQQLKFFSSKIESKPAKSNKIDTKSCLADDPSIHMTTPQLIALHGYRSESHTIVTEDGYILTIHRIPYSKNMRESPRNTVLLHHGLLGSSADWIIPGPEKGLAYILSDAGYDVWLANVRGNTYSRAHVSRNINSFAFWNFTFHEVSQHDLPAVIDYITEIKGADTKIDYIGHSMGTTVLFALLSTRTEYNNKLRAGYALAPVAYMSKIRSPIRLFARFSDNLEYLMKLFGANEFLPQNTVLNWLSEHACEINHYEEAICENSMFVLCGHDASQFNKTLLPLILGHTPAGASTKTLIHYAQEIKNNGRFQQFDYGPKDNLIHYGSPTPPEYNLDLITLPVALFSSENDWLASDIDVTNLYIHLKNPIGHYVVPLKEFNHIDFLYAIDAPKLVYAKLLELLNEVATHNIPYDENEVDLKLV